MPYSAFTFFLVGLAADSTIFRASACMAKTFCIITMSTYLYFSVLAHFSSRSQSVELPSAALGKMVEGDYTFRVIVTTFLNQTSLAAHTLTKQRSGIAPMTQITTSNKVKIQSGLILNADISVSSVCPGSTVISFALISPLLYTFPFQRQAWQLLPDLLIY